MYAVPTCGAPVGEGAIRVLTGRVISKKVNNVRTMSVRDEQILSIDFLQSEHARGNY